MVICVRDLKRGSEFEDFENFLKLYEPLTKSLGIVIIRAEFLEIIYFNALWKTHTLHSDEGYL